MNRVPRFALVLTLGMAAALSGCRPAQIGVDPDAFKAVDALYTAVSLRAPKLVAQCDANLQTLHTAGKIPDAAASTLDALIARANKGEWEPAIDGLAQFMAGQRRH